MVVINTKKIFIIILVSSLLLVGSTLTVFATDFEFSAPENDISGYYTNNYNGFVYNYISEFEIQLVFSFSGSQFTNHVYFSEYGFNFLSQNGADVNNMYNVFLDFIEGNVGNHYDVFCVYDFAYPDICDIYVNGSNASFYGFYNSFPDAFNVVSDLNKQFFNYEIQYNTLNSQLSSLQIQYNSLLSQYQQLLTDYQNLQTTNNDLQSAINILVSDNGALNAQLVELQNQYNALEIRYNDLQSQYNDLVDFYSEELTRLLNENNELRTFLQNADTQINNLEYEINRLRQANAEEYMRGYTQAFEDYDLFEDGLYSIFSAPFTIVYELAEIEVFGFSIVRIVGIILLFVVLSFILAFIWKVIPLL